MIRRSACVLILLLLVGVLSGCGNPAAPDSGRIRIVCTIFPPYDWVRQILGDQADGAELALLLRNRVDLHNFQPTVDDMIRISSCDLFIHAGGESDAWVGAALSNASNPDRIVIDLLAMLGGAAKAEDIVEGMEGGDEDDGDSFDEHVWLSLRNAKLFCAGIAEALSVLDAGNADVYRANLIAYDARLSALDAEYRAAVDQAAVQTLLFADRFPFRYLVDDYGLGYFAAFPGCSAETEAGFDTIVYLAAQADTLCLKSFVVTESADQSIAKAIINNTASGGQRILVLDSMQSVTGEDIQGGVTYLSVMEKNLYTLQEAMR